ncbi:MAG TPA: putative lipid II flippase FtsW [Terrimesophilobacter sp.]|nr:putative lipid II flippase FtsW [Terrimesophilobacter sp.]
MTTSPPRRPSGAPSPSPGPSRSTSPGIDEGKGAGVVVAVRRLFKSETGNYFLVLGTTLFLVVFGLIMVLSSSSVSSFKQSDDFFATFARQGMFALLAIPVMLLASRMPTAFWRRWAGFALVLALTLQFLVIATPLGISHQGNTNWIEIAGVRGQPSELVKVALVLWLGMILAQKLPVLDDWKEMLPIGAIAVTAAGLVVLGHDLGTTIILVAIIFGAAFFAGVRLRLLAIPAALVLVGAWIMTMTGSRAERIAVWQTGCTSPDDYNLGCWQTLHGWWALASGGTFGVGLGNSKAKWSWLPEADNDFIFAIIGEELGLIGAVLVLVLFTALAIGFVRIIRASTDPFAKITVSAIMAWILGQAFINIAVVLGLLPVLGVPLPLISAGGSSLVTTLLAIGIAMSFARRPSHPEAPAASPLGRS